MLLAFGVLVVHRSERNASLPVQLHRYVKRELVEITSPSPDEKSPTAKTRMQFSPLMYLKVCWLSIVRSYSLCLVRGSKIYSAGESKGS